MVALPGLPALPSAMIIYACPDLIFASRIRATTDALGYVSRPARGLVMLQKRLDRIDDGKPNDAVTLVIIDLGLGDVGLDMITAVRKHDDTLPVVAYASHVLTDVLAAASERGATQVTTNGAFTKNLEKILKEFATA